MNDLLHAARPERDTLEARFSLAVCARLSEGCESLPHDLAERLRFARERALEQPRAARPGGVPASIRPRAASGGWWWRAASALPGVLLVAGLVLIESRHDDEQTQAAADLDAALLSDDLPPTAYTDPGFAEFLKSPGG